MIVSRLEKTISGDAVIVSARYEWEDSERPPRTIAFRVPAEFAEDVAAEPDAFLIAGYLPAARHGERRIRIEGPVCPVLADGLARVSAVVDSWAGRPSRSVAIEPARFEAPVPPSRAHAAGFFSGGIDSSHLFLRNRGDFPASHPERLRDAIVVEGADFPGEEDSPDAVHYADRVRARIAATAGNGGVTLIPVRSNVRALEPDLDFYAREYLGTSLAAVAAIFSRRLSSARIAAGADAAHLGRWGTHPLIDPNLSTAGLAIEHDGIGWSRFEKVEALAGWPAAIENLVVCNYRPPAPWVNCGICEKCVATMLELTAAGLLDRTATFPFREVSPDRIGRLPHVSGVTHIWRFLRERMRILGRRDLERPIAALLARTRLRDALRAGRALLRGHRPPSVSRSRGGIPADPDFGQNFRPSPASHRSAGPETGSGGVRR